MFCPISLVVKSDIQRRCFYVTLMFISRQCIRKRRLPLMYLSRCTQRGTFRLKWRKGSTSNRDAPRPSSLEYPRLKCWWATWEELNRFKTISHIVAFRSGGTWASHSHLCPSLFQPYPPQRPRGMSGLAFASKYSEVRSIHQVIQLRWAYLIEETLWILSPYNGWKLDETKLIAEATRIRFDFSLFLLDEWRSCSTDIYCAEITPLLTCDCCSQVHGVKGVIMIRTDKDIP